MNSGRTQFKPSQAVSVVNLAASIEVVPPMSVSQADWKLGYPWSCDHSAQMSRGGEQCGPGSGPDVSSVPGGLFLRHAVSLSGKMGLPIVSSPRGDPHVRPP